MIRPWAWRAASATPGFVVASLTALAAPALAQDAARGEQLYREGVEAYAKGDLTSACPRFEESLAADRQAAPLFMWAKCAHKEGKLASALERYEEVLRLGGLDDQLRNEASKAVVELGPRVPKLSFSRGAVPELAIVRVDGALVTVGGRPLSLDPGQHTVRVELAGHEPFEASAQLTEGQTTSFELQLGPAITTIAASSSVDREPTGSRGGLHPLTLGDFIAGGVGLAGFVVGGITGGMILGACDGDLACANRTDDDPSMGLRVANGVGFGVGIAGVATGVVLLILSATSDDAAEAVARLPLAPAPDASVGFGLGWSF